MIISKSPKFERRLRRLRETGPKLGIILSYNIGCFVWDDATSNLDLFIFQHPEPPSLRMGLGDTPKSR